MYGALGLGARAPTTGGLLYKGLGALIQGYWAWGPRDRGRYYYKGLGALIVRGGGPNERAFCLEIAGFGPK